MPIHDPTALTIAVLAIGFVFWLAYAIFAPIQAPKPPPQMPDLTGPLRELPPQDSLTLTIMAWLWSAIVLGYLLFLARDGVRLLWARFIAGGQ
ncbi:MAG TPA: hypothetical protein VIM84_15785 [Gemmatimonadales bacterium]